MLNWFCGVCSYSLVLDRCYWVSTCCWVIGLLKGTKCRFSTNLNLFLACSLESWTWTLEKSFVIRLVLWSNGLLWQVEFDLISTVRGMLLLLVLLLMLIHTLLMILQVILIVIIVAVTSVSICTCGRVLGTLATIIAAVWANLRSSLNVETRLINLWLRAATQIASWLAIFFLFEGCELISRWRNVGRCLISLMILEVELITITITGVVVIEIWYKHRSVIERVEGLARIRIVLLDACLL